MDQELKEALEGVKTQVEAFKKKNDAVLAEMATKGHVDSILKEETDRLNESITVGIDTAKARFDELERKFNRADLHGSAGEEKLFLEAQKFAGILTREGKPRPELSVEASKEYKAAFDVWMRVGPEGVSAQERASLSVGSDPKGGYYVTPDTTGRMVSLIFESSPMRSLASAQTIGTSSLEGKTDLDEADSGWVGEKQARPETGTAEVGEWDVPVREQYAAPKATQKLLDDANIDMGAWIERKGAEKFERRENEAFVIGDGDKRPRGFLTYPHGVPTAATWQQIERTPTGSAGAFGALGSDRLIQLQHGLKKTWRRNAWWVMNSKTLGATRTLKDGQGNYLWIPDFAAGLSGRLLGSPIEEFEDMPDIAADSLSIGYGDFREGYQIVDRTGVRILRDPFTNKPFVIFYMTKRVGGDVINFEAIKLMRFAVNPT